jgi:hypothetical protein
MFIFIISEMLVFHFVLSGSCLKQNSRHTVLLPHTTTSLQHMYTSDAKSNFSQHFEQKPA